MNCICIFIAIFSLYRPVKSAVVVRPGKNVVYSPINHAFDNLESFSYRSTRFGFTLAIKKHHQKMAINGS